MFYCLFFLFSLFLILFQRHDWLIIVFKQRFLFCYCSHECCFFRILRKFFEAYKCFFSGLKNWGSFGVVSREREETLVPTALQTAKQPFFDIFNFLISISILQSFKMEATRGDHYLINCKAAKNSQGRSIFTKQKIQSTPTNCSPRKKKKNIKNQHKG